MRVQSVLSQDDPFKSCLKTCDIRRKRAENDAHRKIEHSVLLN